jgi:transglutaminase-like putative cysteine protease
MMHRRKFVNTISSGLAAAMLPIPALAKSAKKNNEKTENDDGTGWRLVEVTNQISVPSQDNAKIWIPVPLAQTSYQELVATSWDGNFANASIVKDRIYSASFFYAEWKKSGPANLNVTYLVRLKNRAQAESATAQAAELYLKPTKHVPLDGIVKTTADKIVKSETDDDKKAKLIYQWVVDNTSRDAKIQGCGLGDIKAMLDMGNLSGKCADLSSLFVGLCRAVGVPAREVFGLRVLPSELFKSIGKFGDISKGQHCRAEYYAKARGWVPVDPADIGKIILEEKLSPSDAAVQKASEKFFGFWEMNWIAYNSARDVTIPPAYTDSINYFMYPRLVSGQAQNDGMDPEQFQYTITSREIFQG